MRSVQADLELVLVLLDPDDLVVMRSLEQLQVLAQRGLHGGQHPFPEISSGKYRKKNYSKPQCGKVAK